MTVRELSADTLVLDRHEYARLRPALRKQAMALRAVRRVQLGEQVLVEFENRDTLHYQVQEMVYAENISTPAAAGHEVTMYARLMPGVHQLVATLFVELTDPGTVRSELMRLTGLQHRIRLEVGGHVVAAIELPGPDEDGPAELTYSVHFLRFGFDDGARDAFRDPAEPARLVVDHPEYRAVAVIDGETRRSLIADLAQPA